MTRLSSRSLPLIVLMAGGLALSACVGGPAGLGGEPPLTPTSRYSLQVEPGLERIALAVHETGVSVNQRAALGDLVNRFAMEGAPVLVIEAPSGGDPVAAEATWGVRAILQQAGVPENRIQVAAYVAPDPRAPVLVGFETVRAVVPQCGTQWGNLGRSGDNQSASNFGCAVNANLAAQIADPRDIVAPRGMTPSEAGRRAVVFDAYRKGAATSAAREPLLSQMRISQAIQ